MHDFSSEKKEAVPSAQVQTSTIPQTISQTPIMLPAIKIKKDTERVLADEENNDEVLQINDDNRIKPVTPEVAKTEIKKDEILYPMQFSALFGNKWYKANQSGVFGSTTSTLFAYNKYTIAAGIAFEKLWLEYNFSQCFMRLPTDRSGADSNISKSLRSMDLIVGYGMLFLNISSDDFPVSSPAAGTSVSWTNLSVVTAAIGVQIKTAVQKNYETKKQTEIKSRIQLGLPIYENSENNIFAIKNFKGYAIKVGTEISRDIIRPNNFNSVKGIISVDLGAQSFKYQGTWGSLDGQVKNSDFSLGAQIGLRIGF